MNLRNIVDEYGAKICAGYQSGIYAEFAPAEETVGFISTSANGARGIVFMCDKMRVNLDGGIMQAEYAAIESVEVLDSGEGAYADELVIKAGGESLRISDFSLEKRELKLLIEEIRRANAQMTDKERESAYNDAMLAAAEYFSQAAPLFSPPKPEIEKRSAAIPDGYTPAQITEERIDWISGPSHGAVALKQEDEIPANQALAAPPVIPETVIEPTADEADEDISEMSHEQTLSYLFDAINEINASVSAPAAPRAEPVSEQGAVFAAAEEQTPYVMPAAQPVQTAPTALAQPVEQAAPAAAVIQNMQTAPAFDGQQPVQPLQSVQSVRQLSVEPISDDIYIKASRILREYCEQGTLTQQGIETAVKEGLVPAAEGFMEVMAQNAPMAQGLAERIEELKAASDRIEDYFVFGEDVAARVMFFMLYQMLSYADRLAERPETKQRLNDFFKRWGAAGITLSMLDMRVQ